MKTKFHLLQILVICSLKLNETQKIDRQIYRYLSQSSYNLCSLRYNYTQKSGCQSYYRGNIGILYLVRNKNDSVKFFREKFKNYIIPVISISVFVDAEIMNKIKVTPKINGIVVLEPDSCEEKLCTAEELNEVQLYNVNEYTVCQFYDDCAYAEPYYDYLWPYPIVFINNRGNSKTVIHECLEITTKYFNNTDDKRMCGMEINNPQIELESGIECKYFYNTKLTFISWIKKIKYCEEYIGNNYYLGFFNKKNITDGNKFILLYARMDSISMFDTAAYGTTTVFPAISIILGIINSLTQTLYEFTDYKNDILIALIDSDSTDLLGSRMLVKHLEDNTIKFDKKVFNIQNLLFSLKLEELTNGVDNSMYLIFNKMTRYLEKNNFINQLFEISKANSVTLFSNGFDIIEGEDFVEELKTIYVRDHFIRRKHMYKDSFLDKYNLHNATVVSQNLDNLVRIFSLFIFKVIDFNGQQNFSKYTAEIYICLVENAFCDFMEKIENRLESLLYHYYGQPLKTQFTYKTDLKDKMKSVRISDVIKDIIVFLTFYEFSNVNACNGKPLQFNLKIGKKFYCVKSNLVHFRGIFEGNKMIVHEIADEFVELFQFRSGMVGRKYVRLFLLPTLKSETTILVIGTILMALFFVAVIFIHRNIDKLINDSV